MNAVLVQPSWTDALSVFCSPKYLHLLGRDYGWIAGVDENGHRRCLLPFAIVDKKLLRLARFPVETLAIGPDLEPRSERLFLDSAMRVLEKLGVDVVIPASFNSLFKTFPNGALAVPYANVVVDLEQSEDLLWRAIHPKHRNVIRNAERNGVIVKFGPEYVSAALGLMQASLTRSAGSTIERWRVKARLSGSDLHRLVEELGEHIAVFVAERDGIVQAAAIVPFSTYSAYYMYGGTTTNPVTGAANLLQWEIMRHFRAQHVARYDFYGVRAEPAAGSKAEGIRRFKERFGGKLRNGYMWKFPLNKRGYLLYQCAAQLRSGGDVVDQEMRRSKAAIPSAADRDPS